MGNGTLLFRPTPQRCALQLLSDAPPPQCTFWRCRARDNQVEYGCLALKGNKSLLLLSEFCVFLAPGQLEYGDFDCVPQILEVPKQIEVCQEYRPQFLRGALYPVLSLHENPAFLLGPDRWQRRERQAKRRGRGPLGW